MKQLLIIFLVTTFIGGCTGTDTGNPISGTDTGNPTVVAGVIMDSSGPISNTSVWVRRTDSVAIKPVLLLAKYSSSLLGTYKFFAVTDMSGTFKVKHVPAGEYALYSVDADSSLGLMHHFTVTASDTLTLLESLVLTATQELQVSVSTDMVGMPAYIPELDTTFTIGNTPVTISNVPKGVYTVIISKAPREVTTVPVKPSSVPSSSSSSSIVNSSTYPTSSSSMSSSSIVSSPIAWITVTKGTYTDGRDSAIYQVTKVGSSVWFSRSVSYNTGGPCNPNDPDVASCSSYGRFYTYSQLMGACPPGWRVPLAADWDALIEAVGSLADAGRVLKSTGGWTTPGIDSINFKAFPAGSLANPVLGSDAFFWEDSLGGNSFQVVHFTNTNQLTVEPVALTDGYSMRCVQ